MPVFVQVQYGAGVPELQRCRLSPNSIEKWTGYFNIHIAPLLSFSGVESMALLDLKPLIQSNPALQSATAAVGAMFRLKGPASLSSKTAYHVTAFEHYAMAVTQVKSAIAQLKVCLFPTLWTVFLLSLFELMVDFTGQNWIKHTLSGVSKLLDAIGPVPMLQDGYRALFLELRIFEASRALITNTQTILARPDWVSLRSAYQVQHPSQVLIDIMLDAADLGWR